MTQGYKIVPGSRSEIPRVHSWLKTNVTGWILTALFNGSWTFFAVPNHNCDETKKKKLIEIYQP